MLQFFIIPHEHRLSQTKYAIFLICLLNVLVLYDLCSYILFENRIPLKALLVGVRDVTVFHYSS